MKYIDRAPVLLYGIGKIHRVWRLGGYIKYSAKAERIKVAEVLSYGRF